MNRHDQLVECYRAMDKAIARKLRANPSLIQNVRENLLRWIEQERKQTGFVSPPKLEWLEILDHSSLDQIIDILETDTEEHDWLLHSSPFCGILSEDERQRYATLSA
jgi:hypothetical protein